MNYLLKRHRCLLGAVAAGLAILTAWHPHLIACNSALDGFISNVQAPILAVILSINAASVGGLYNDATSIKILLNKIKANHKEINTESPYSKAEKVESNIFSNVYWLFIDLSTSIAVVIVKDYFSGHYALSALNAIAIYTMIDGLIRLALMVRAIKVINPLMQRIETYKDSAK